MPTPAEAVLTYILAKDGNRPFLMKQAFAENVELEMVVPSDIAKYQLMKSPFGLPRLTISPQYA